MTKKLESMLRWFAHVERMNESRVTKDIFTHTFYKANVSEQRLAGRPRRIYIDLIGVVLQ